MIINPLDANRTLIENTPVNVRPKSRSLAPLALLFLVLATIVLLVQRQSSSATLLHPTSEIRNPKSVQISLPSGSYDQPIDVTLSSPNPEASIYFTTDGSLPTSETGTLYTDPIHIPAGQPRAVALRARALLPDGESGPPDGAASNAVGSAASNAVGSATYFMNLDTAIPLLSLTIDPQDLWDDESGIFANPHMIGREWERPADVYYYDPQQGFGIQAPAGARVHGAGSRVYDKKSMRLYFRDEYGEPFLEYQVFPGLESERFKRLVLHDGGQDFPAVSYNGTLLRNELVSNLVHQAGGYATHSRPALLFINGQPWGIYNIRERIDDRFLEENFHIEDADLLSGFEHRLDAQSGDRAHWDHLLEFVAANDLTDEANYNYVQTQVNLDNFINYALIQIITANADWPHNNQLKFRDRANGRWHWMFWDSDYAFGLMTNSYIDKNMFTHILDHEDERQQQASMLMRKLLQNPDFKTRFLNRLADLLNTVFATDNVLAEIDRLAGTIEEDIPYETRRWPGAGNWEAGVEYMRDFARQRPDIVRSQTVEAFDLPGVATLTINPPIDCGFGIVDCGLKSEIRNPKSEIVINGSETLNSEDLPWQGHYFQGVDIHLTAVPEPGYRFLDWGTTEIPPDAELTLSLSEDLVLTPRFERTPAQAGVDQNAMPGSVIFSSSGPRDSDNAPVDGMQGEWIELQVTGPRPVDLRGWRISDNDSLTATDEGSLLLGDDPALANVPPGVSILLVPTETPANDRLFPEDELSPANGFRNPSGSGIILYGGNDNLDTHSDPWFAIGAEDTLYLLAPGPTVDLADDVLIDTLSIGQDE